VCLDCRVTIRHSRVSNPSLYPNFHELKFGFKELCLFWLMVFYNLVLFRP